MEGEIRNVIWDVDGVFVGLRQRSIRHVVDGQYCQAV